MDIKMLLNPANKVKLINENTDKKIFQAIIGAHKQHKQT